MRRKLTVILAIIMISAFNFSYMITANIGDTHQIPSDNPQFEVTLLSVEYDEDKGEQTWTYEIKCLSNADHDISHSVFAFAEICDPPLTEIIGAGPGNPEISVSYSKTFPHEGVSGIEFDTPVNKGDSIVVWFTLKGQWPLGTMGFWIKAGTPIYSGIIDGPECIPDLPVPETPLGIIGSIAAMIAAMLFISSKRQSLIKI